METAEDVTGPEITSPADVTFSEGTTGNTISWTATDANPDEYRITRNGDLAESRTWISGSPIIYDIDALTSGSYVFVMTVSDEADMIWMKYPTCSITTPPLMIYPMLGRFGMG